MADFIKFVQKLQKGKAKDLVQFFDRKSYYVAYGDDASLIAKEYFKTTGTIKYLGDKKELPYVNIGLAQLGEILRTLITNKQYKWEIYANKPSTSQWERSKKGSPGNTQDLDELISINSELENSSSVIISVCDASEGGRNIIGVSVVDTTARTIVVGQFDDNDYFSNFESVVVQMAGAKECLMDYREKDARSRLIDDVLQRAGVLRTNGPRADFKANDIEQDLNRLLGSIQNNLPELEHTHAMKATACLIKYLELLSDNSNFGKYRMKRLDLSMYMRLDAAAVEALNLVPTRRDGGQDMNLYSVLNRCITKSGGRLLMQWIKQPLLDVEQIEMRQNVIEAFYEDVELRKSLRMDHIKKMPRKDMAPTVKKFYTQKAALKECVELYEFARLLPGVRGTLTKYPGPHGALLSERYAGPLERIVEELTPFLQMINDTVDLDSVAHHEYLIRPHFDDDLAALYREREEIDEEITTLKERVAKQLPRTIKNLRLDHAPQWGHHFRVTRKDEQALRKANFKYQSLDVRKDGVKFTTVDLRQLSKRYQDLSAKYEEKQSSLISQLIEITSEYMTVIEDANDVVTELDVFAGLAEVFASFHCYVRPKVLPLIAEGEGETSTGKGRHIILKAARHPCVEAIQNGTTFIPNDVELDRDGSFFQIITGPNMGGKSTYIRQVGVIVLMAQMGCFVPCKSAELSVVDCILARVGAGDSQTRGVSTFMAEMLETTSILRAATGNSLIIIDELGRGTSTYDGFGLAWAISEHLSTNVKAFCFFATHFHELTALEGTVDGVSNLHVAALAEEDKLELLYEVKKGSCDQSFGIKVAEMADFPSSVIEHAKRKASELESFEAKTKLLQNTDNIDDGGNEDGRKRQRTADDVADGDGDNAAEVSKFLRAFRAIPLDQLSEEECRTRVQQWRKEVMATERPAILEMLSQL
eukprot:TRINITY_DN5998_c0_g2_i1.p1 TRINITY_DN5998_c0_g2~~TRINITY_DN5998_c0_g2_i1.p1  ORF type:complete len:930 (+),score=265.26 TRINITY_DN5998_c0_g2_i1:162-2951(+)